MWKNNTDDNLIHNKLSCKEELFQNKSSLFCGIIVRIYFSKCCSLMESSVYLKLSSRHQVLPLLLRGPCSSFSLRG